MCTAYLHRPAACLKINNKFEYNELHLCRLGLNEEPLAMIRLVSFCYRRAPVTLLASELLLNDEDKSSFGIFRAFPCSPDCNVLGSACIDDSLFRCSPSAYLMQISWIFVCRASFHQVTASIDALRLLLLHAYYFCASTCQRTILLLSILRNSRLTQDCRCPNDLPYKV